MNESERDFNNLFLVKILFEEVSFKVIFEGREGCGGK